MPGRKHCVNTEGRRRLLEIAGIGHPEKPQANGIARLHPEVIRKPWMKDHGTFRPVAGKSTRSRVRGCRHGIGSEAIGFPRDGIDKVRQHALRRRVGSADAGSGGLGEENAGRAHADGIRQGRHFQSGIGSREETGRIEFRRTAAEQQIDPAGQLRGFLKRSQGDVEIERRRLFRFETEGTHGGVGNLGCNRQALRHRQVRFTRKRSIAREQARFFKADNHFPSLRLARQTEGSRKWPADGSSSRRWPPCFRGQLPELIRDTEEIDIGGTLTSVGFGHCGREQKDRNDLAGGGRLRGQAIRERSGEESIARKHHGTDLAESDLGLPGESGTYGVARDERSADDGRGQRHAEKEAGVPAPVMTEAAEQKM